MYILPTHPPEMKSKKGPEGFERQTPHLPLRVLKLVAGLIADESNDWMTWAQIEVKS